MPKLIPVPDELSKPFWDAINNKQLLVQNCTRCNNLQYPPRPTCRDCGSGDLEWKEASGRGQILANMVVADGRLAQTRPDQPFNLAVIALEEEPRINFFSNLPGLPPYQVPIGASVEVIYEEVEPGRLIHEWRLVSS